MKTKLFILTSCLLSLSPFLLKANDDIQVCLTGVAVVAWMDFIWKMSNEKRKATRRKRMEQVFFMHYRNRRNFA